MPDRHGTVLKGTTYRYTNVNSCTKLHTLFILSKIVVCESLAVATNPIPHPYSYLLLWNTLRIFYFYPTLRSLTNDFFKPILECYMYLNQSIANGAGICQNILKCYLQYFHIRRPLYDKKITHDAYIWWQFVHKISFWQKSCMLFWRRKKMILCSV